MIDPPTMVEQNEMKMKPAAVTRGEIGTEEP
jgi:hypothetical protein